MFCNFPRSTGPVSKQKPLTVRKRSGASKTRYHPASAGFPALAAADNGASRSALLRFQAKRSGASSPMLPHRLTPAAGSLQAGITGFLPIQAFNSVNFKRVFPLCQGFSCTSQHFSAFSALFPRIAAVPRQIRRRASPAPASWRYWDRQSPSPLIKDIVG